MEDTQEAMRQIELEEAIKRRIQEEDDNEGKGE